jgi:branched-subunit amino acid aminotransferase/4-amino-4-deoxychorismate lyase
LVANELADARIRLTVSAGRGAGRPDLSNATAPTVLVVAEPPPPDPPPARVVVASQRVDASRALPTAKTANYLASLLALAEARAAGADEALLLSSDGAIVEAATANVFVVLGGALYTPPLASGPLPGVTREAVLECAQMVGVEHLEVPLTLSEVARAEEVFLTNSVVGLRPVRTIADWWPGSDQRGPVTGLLDRCYRELIRQECALG